MLYYGRKILLFDTIRVLDLENYCTIITHKRNIYHSFFLHSTKKRNYALFCTKFIGSCLLCYSYHYCLPIPPLASADRLNTPLAIPLSGTVDLGSLLSNSITFAPVRVEKVYRCAYRQTIIPRCF